MSIRRVYVIENQDCLAPASALTDQQAREAILDLYYTGMTDEQWALACADLTSAGRPIEERHARYLELVAARDAAEVGRERP